MTKANINIGTEIYYTGDMANSSGFFKVVKIEGNNATLQELDEGYTEDRNPTIMLSGIGNNYAGHCNPRFVTRESYNAYRAAILAKMSAA